MKMNAIGADCPGRPSDIGRQRHPVQAVKRRGNALISLSPRAAIASVRRAGNASGMRWLVGKLLLLIAVALMVVAVVQRPSMLLLCITPKGVAATAVRLFMGLLAAMAIRACVPGMARRSHALLRSRGKTLVAFALMLVLLALMYRVVGSRAFSMLRLGDLVMHRAYLTQVLAFAALWLTLLR